jgi:hypothetical protein
MTKAPHRKRSPRIEVLPPAADGCGGGLLEPGANLGGRLWMLARQGPALEDALDGLSHVQPAAAERRIERHVYNGMLGSGFGQRFQPANDRLPQEAVAA